jgi:hypothetical protein
MPIPADLLGIDAAQEADVDLYLGASYYDEGVISVDGVVSPLTGCTVVGAIKATDTGAVLVAFTGTVVDAPTAKVRFTLTPAQTAALTFTAADGEQLGVYDYQVSDGTDKIIFRRGRVRGRYKRNAS